MLLSKTLCAAMIGCVMSTLIDEQTLYIVDILEHVIYCSCILFVVNWEVRLKPPNIALSLALHWLPGKGSDRIVFVLWACSFSARSWLDLPWTLWFTGEHRSWESKPLIILHYIIYCVRWCCAQQVDHNLEIEMFPVGNYYEKITILRKNHYFSDFFVK